MNNKWKLKDILMVGIVGVLFSFVFLAVDYIGAFLTAALTPFGLSALGYGMERQDGRDLISIKHNTNSSGTAQQPNRCCFFASKKCNESSGIFVLFCVSFWLHSASGVVK